MRRARAQDHKDPVAAVTRFVSSKAAEDFPRDEQDRTTIAVYIFGIAIRGQKYNSEFRFGRWKISQIPKSSRKAKE